MIDNKIQALDEALEFAQKIGRTIQEFNSDSAKTADKWQRRAEKKLEDKQFLWQIAFI